MVVLAHPKPGSFSHALADVAEKSLRDAGHHVATHDLYTEGFCPVLSREGARTTRMSDDDALDADADPMLRTHRDEIVTAHTLVVVHPNWWGKPPAIMAGWMDRVLAPGVVYDLDDAGGLPRTLITLRRLIVLNTGDTDLEREASVFGDPLESIWRRCVGTYLAGVAVERMLIGPMAGSTAEQRARWLESATDMVTGVPET